MYKGRCPTAIGLMPYGKILVDEIEDSGGDTLNILEVTSSEATTSAKGYMSATDKTKLDGIAAGAQVNAVTSVNGNTGNVNLDAADLGAVAVTGDNMTGNLTLGNGTTNNITLDATAGGATFVGDAQMASQNGGQLAGFRNQIINGSGAIAQRGATVTAVADGDYTVDRWNTGGGVVVSSLSGVGALCPGIDNGIAITTTAGRNWIRQGIELGSVGFAGKFTGKWTVGLWATQAPSVAISFSDDASFTNPIQVQPLTAMTVTGLPDRVNGIRTYTHYSLTIDITQNPSAANTCLTLQLSFPVSSQTLFTGVQLEPGPVATPFEHRPIGTELALCQRYYQVRSSGTVAAADLRPTMRATPTVSGNNYDAEL